MSHIEVSLENHDRIPAGVLPPRQRCKASTLADGKPFLELRVKFHDTAVVWRLRDEDDQPIRTKVPELQERLSLDGLDVNQPSLGLDQDQRIPDVDGRIGRPKIAGNGHRHLRAEGERWIDPEAKALEQCKMGAVSDRVTVRIERNPELETHDGRDAGCEINGQGARITAFGTGDPVRSHAGLARDLADAEASGETCSSELIGQAMPKQATPLRPDSCETFSTGHWRSIPIAAQPVLIRRCRVFATLVDGRVWAPSQLDRQVAFRPRLSQERVIRRLPGGGWCADGVPMVIRPTSVANSKQLRLSRVRGRAVATGALGGAFGG
jgi:hypothetical protein